MSTSGTSRSVTVGDLRRDRVDQLRQGYRPVRGRSQQLPGGAAERELGLLGGQEVAVHRVVGVDADTAVHVHDGVRHAVAGVGRPERRGGHVDVGGQVLGEPPRRLGQRQPQRP